MSGGGPSVQDVQPSSLDWVKAKGFCINHGRDGVLHLGTRVHRCIPIPMMCTLQHLSQLPIRLGLVPYYVIYVVQVLTGRSN